MRTATTETTKALRKAIGDEPYSRWAKAHGLKPATVHAILHGLPMKAKRENTVRALLDLPAIEWERIEIEPARQKIVNRQKPRPYRTRQLRLAPDEAAALDEFVRERGYRSFNQWWKSTQRQNGYSSELEATHTQHNGSDNTSYKDTQWP